MIKIEDLPVLEELGTDELQGIFGGARNAKRRNRQSRKNRLTFKKLSQGTIAVSHRTTLSRKSRKPASKTNFSPGGTIKLTGK